MPQLDIFTFVPQVFWLIVVFALLYFVLLGTGLPKVYKVLVYRKKKLESYAVSIERLNKEIFFVKNFLIKHTGKSFLLYKNVGEVPFKVVDVHLNFLDKELKNSLFLKDSLVQFETLNSLGYLQQLNLLSLVKSSKYLKSKSSILVKIKN